MSGYDNDKKIKKEIRALATKAHEEELRRALLPIAEKFGQWKMGGITSFELSEAIHKFHNGDAREIFKRYEYSPEKMSVAAAILNGILKQESIPPEVLEELKNEISFFSEGS